MKEPTHRQQQVLDFIRKRLEAGEPVPTVREIAKELNLSSSSSAQLHLSALRRKGWLQRAEGSEGAARSLKLTGEGPKRMTGVPLLGAIPAGLADLRSQEQEGLVHVDLDSLKIPRSHRVFALKVTGDSMIGKHIMDGDIVILEQNADPKPGDVVAALIDGQSTLKTFLLERGRPFLRAENPRYPNLIPLSELMIQGVMRMLLRTPGGRK